MPAGRHKDGKVFLGIWVEKEFKEMLRKDAAQAQLPKWTVTDQIRYEILERRGLWTHPYHPNRPTREGSRKRVA